MPTAYSLAVNGTVSDMVAVLILGLALVAVGQFWMIWWRATLGSLAETPLSDRLRAAAKLEGEITGNDFQTLLGMFQSCPSLRKDGRSLSFVQKYYSVVRLLARIGASLPAVAEWASNEMATCARYAAVCVDQRMQRTRTILAEMRSY